MSQLYSYLYLYMEAFFSEETEPLSSTQKSVAVRRATYVLCHIITRIQSDFIIFPVIFI